MFRGSNSTLTNALGFMADQFPSKDNHNTDTEMDLLLRYGAGFRVLAPIRVELWGHIDKPKHQQ